MCRGRGWSRSTPRPRARDRRRARCCDERSASARGRGCRATHRRAAAERRGSRRGRAAVICAEEQVAQIPSHWIDAERACPATTYYRSVQVHGLLEEVSDPDAKARVLSALMTKFQPEGGYVPIAATHPLYKNAVKG